MKRANDLRFSLFEDKNLEQQLHGKKEMPQRCLQAVYLIDLFPVCSY
jgi:hypothetical protein